MTTTIIRHNNNRESASNNNHSPDQNSYFHHIYNFNSILHHAYFVTSPPYIPNNITVSLISERHNLHTSNIFYDGNFSSAKIYPSPISYENLPIFFADINENNPHGNFVFDAVNLPPSSIADRFNFVDFFDSNLGDSHPIVFDYGNYGTLDANLVLTPIPTPSEIVSTDVNVTLLSPIFVLDDKIFLPNVNSDSPPIPSISPPPTTVVDISIIKFDNAGGSSLGDHVGTVQPGQTYTYTISLTNLGSDSVDSLNLVDKLPDGFHITSLLTSAGDYNSSTGVWSNLGDHFAPGEMITLQITGSLITNASTLLADSSNGDIINIATVTPVSGSLNTNTNNVAVDVDDLNTVVKADSGGGNSSTHTMGALVAGASETYTITVSNPGSTAVTGTFYDPLNSTFTNDIWSATVTGGASASLSSGSGAVGTSIDPLTLTLPSNSSITFTITGTEALSANGIAQNQVVYQPSNSSPVITTDTDALVTVVKSDSGGGSSPTTADPSGIVGTLIAGAHETYNITITNTSNTSVTGELSDSFFLSLFEAGTTHWTATAATGDSVDVSSGTGAIIDDSLHLLGDSSITFSISGIVNPNAPTSVSNTAEFTPTGGSSVGITDTDVVNSVVKSDSGGGSSATGAVGTLVSGAQETYTIVITNNSSVNETGTISDPLNAGFTNDSWNAVGTNGASINTATGTGAITSDSLILPADSSITFTITGTESLTATGTVANQAIYTPNGAAPVIITDSSNIVSAVKSDSGGGTSATVAHPVGVTGAFVAGAQESYSITLSNTSANTVTGSLSDANYLSLFQAGTIHWTAILASGDTASVTSGTGAISADNLSLSPDSSMTFTVTGVVSQAAPDFVSNTADFTPTNGSTVGFTDNDGVMQIVKSDSGGGTSPTSLNPSGVAGTFVAGAHETYTITLVNPGLTTITGELTDNNYLSLFKAGSINWSAMASAGDTVAVTSGTGAITNDAVTLLGDSDITFTISGTVSSSAPSTVSNTADFTPTGGSAVGITDTDSVNTVVKSDSGGGSSATGTVGTLVAGAPETYTIVVSNNSSVAETATLSDPLNASFINDTWTAVGTNGATAVTSVGVGAILLDTLILPANSTITFTIAGTEALTATGTVQNQATYTPTGGSPVVLTDTSNVLNIIKSDTGGGTSATAANPTGVIGTFVAGTHESYTIVLSNTSAGTIVGTLSDSNYLSLFQSGTINWSVLATAGDTVAVTSGTGAINSDALTLQSGSEITFTISGTVSSSAPALVSNTADFTPTGGSAVGITDTDAIDTVVKSDSGGGNSATGAVGTLVAGAAETYTIVITNNSSVAETGTFADPLNASFTNDAWTAMGTNGATAVLAAGTGVIASDGLILPANSSITFTITGTEALTASGTVQNQATFTPTGGNPVVVTDTSNIVTAIKADSGGGTSPTVAHPVGVTGTFIAGAQESYTITLSNTSASAITGILSDSDYLNLFQSGSIHWTVALAAGDAASVTTGTGAITNDLLSLAADTTITFTITGIVSQTAPVNVSNTADFTPTNGTPVTFTDSDNVMQMVKADSGGGTSPTAVQTSGFTGTFVAGAAESYTITMINPGLNTITGTLSDSNYLTLFQSGSIHWNAVVGVGDSVAVTTGTGAISNDAITLAAGSEITFTVSGIVSTSAPSTVANTADFTPTGGSTIGITDTDAVNTIVKSDSGGGNSLTGTVGTLVAGSPETYTIVISNNSGVAETGTLSDPLNASFINDTWTAAGTNGASALTTSGSGVISNDGLILPAHSTITFTISGTEAFTANGNVANQATYTPTGGAPVVITDSSDILTVVKSDSGGGTSPTASHPSGVTGTFVAGMQESYIITLNNTSTGTISGALTDSNYLSLFQAGTISWSAAVASGDSVAVASGTGAITNDAVTLLGGSEITFTISGMVSSSAPATVANTADFTPTGGATVGFTDNDSVNTAVKSDSGGGSSATGTAGTLIAGAQETYTIVISNNSGSAETGTLSDPLNASFINDTWTAVGTNGATAVTAVGVGAIPLDALILPANSTITFTITGTEALTATGTVENQATYTPTGGSPVVLTDVSNILTIVKADSGGGTSPTVANPTGVIGTFVAGAHESYTITLSNTSTNTVTGILSDANYLSIFQSGSISWTVAVATGDSVAVTSGTGAITNDAVTLLGGSDITFTISGTVSSSAPALASNTADFTPTGGSTIGITDVDAIDTVVKSDSGGGSSATNTAGTLVAGAPETYTIVITNNSSVAETGTFADPLNASFTNDTWTAIGTNGAAAVLAAGIGAIASDGLILPANSSITFTITGTEALTASGAVQNQATFTPTGGNPVVVTDASNILTAVKADSGGGTSPTAAHPVGVIGTFVAGSQESYTITLTNTSASAMTGTLSDSTFLSLFQTGTTHWTVALSAGDTASVASGSGAITNDALTIAANTTVTFTITGTVSQTDPASVFNTAVFTPTNGTPVGFTDTDNVMQIVKADSGGGSSATNTVGTFVAGAAESYTITLTNPGLNSITGTLSDSNYLSLFQSGSINWNAVTGIGDTVAVTSGTGAISNDAITLAAGTSVTFTISGIVSASAPSTVTNTADFTPAGGATIGITDADNVNTVVKSDSGGGNSATGTVGTLVAGAPETYTIVISNSSSTAETGTISDPLNLSFTNDTWAAVGTNGASAITTSGSGVILTDGLILPAHSTITFTITGTEALTASGTVANQATFTPTGGTPVVITDSSNILTAVKSDTGGGSSATVAHPAGIIGTFVAGTQESYIITLTNTSTNTITGVISDANYLSLFQSGTISWTAVGTGGDTIATTSGTGAITNDAVTLLGGSDIVFTVSGTVAQNVSGSVSNTANFTPTGGSAVAITDTDSINTIVKSDTGGGTSPTSLHPAGVSGALIAGAQETYTIVITNSSATAETATFSDPLYASFINDTWTAAGTNGATALVAAGIGAINNDSLILTGNSSITFTITGTEALTASGQVANQAVYTPTGGSPVTIIDNGNVLDFVKSDSGGGTSPTIANPAGLTGVLVAGEQGSYTITLSNTSINTISGVMSDANYLTLFQSGTVSWSAVGTNGDTIAVTNGTGAISSDALTLFGNSSVTFTISGIVAESAAANVSNTANFTPTGGNTVGITDSDGVDQIVKTDTGGGSSPTAANPSGINGVLVAGASETYTITLTNNSAFAQTGTFSDPLNSGFTNDTWTAVGTNGALAATLLGSGAISNDAITLPANSTLTFTITGTESLSASGSAVNQIAFTPTGGSVVNVTDTDSVVTFVKSDSGGGTSPTAANPAGVVGSFAAGANETYTITLTNTGGTQATGSFVDPLSSYFINDTWTTTGTNGAFATTTSGSGAITPLSVYLPADSSLTFTISGQVSSGAPSTITNTASFAPTNGALVSVTDTDNVTPFSPGFCFSQFSDIINLGNTTGVTLSLLAAANTLVLGGVGTDAVSGTLTTADDFVALTNGVKTVDLVGTGNNVIAIDDPFVGSVVTTGTGNNNIVVANGEASALTVTVGLLGNNVIIAADGSGDGISVPALGNATIIDVNDDLSILSPPPTVSNFTASGTIVSVDGLNYTVENLGSASGTFSFDGANSTAVGSTLVIGSFLGNQIVDVGNSNDMVILGNGNDTVNAGSGMDTIVVGDGNDTLNIGLGTSTGCGLIMFGDGTDIINVGNGSYTIIGTTGNYTITTGSGDNTITLGGIGTNTFNLGNGEDTVIAGVGNNTFTVGSGTYYSLTIANHNFTVSNPDHLNTITANNNGVNVLATEGVVVTIVDESNAQNSISTLVPFSEINAGGVNEVLFNGNNSNFTFNTGDHYVVSIAAAPNNLDVTSIVLTNFSIDGVTLQAGPFTLDSTGVLGPVAETFVFTAGGAVSQSALAAVENALALTLTPTDGNHVYYLFGSGLNTAMSVGTTTTGFGAFMDGGVLDGGVSILPLTETGSTSSVADVMLYNASDTYVGNGKDILNVEQGVLGTSNVNLTSATDIHNIGQILITDPADAPTNGNGTTLTLGFNDVFNFTENTAHTASGNNNTLVINGNASDTVNIGTGWTSAGVVGNYNEYTHVDAVHSTTEHILISSHIHVVT